MDIEFWGVRGTTPVSGKDRQKYGGATPCASVVSSAGDIVIVDAGTGIKRLGESLMTRPRDGKLRLHILLTHFHLDHVLGLPFFAPLYAAGAAITFYSPLSPSDTEKQLRGLMSGRYFPVDFKETASAKKYVRVEQDPLTIGKFEISGCPLNHPQGSFGYRIADRSGSIVFATDTEPPEAGLDERLAGFIRGADFLSATPPSLRRNTRRARDGDTAPGLTASGWRAAPKCRTFCSPTSAPTMPTRRSMTWRGGRSGSSGARGRPAKGSASPRGHDPEMIMRKDKGR